MTGKCKVLLYHPMHSEGTKLLQEKCEIAYVKSRDEKTVMSQASDVEAIILLRHGEVTRGIIQSAPRLKVIGKHGVGVDKIDLKTAKERGIPVVEYEGSDLFDHIRTGDSVEVDGGSGEIRIG